MLDRFHNRATQWNCNTGSTWDWFPSRGDQLALPQRSFAFNKPIYASSNMAWLVQTTWLRNPQHVDFGQLGGRHFATNDWDWETGSSIYPTGGNPHNYMCRPTKLSDSLLENYEHKFLGVGFQRWSNNNIPVGCNYSLSNRWTTGRYWWKDVWSNSATVGGNSLCANSCWKSSTRWWGRSWWVQSLSDPPKGEIHLKGPSTSSSSTTRPIDDAEMIDQRE